MDEGPDVEGYEFLDLPSEDDIDRMVLLDVVVANGQSMYLDDEGAPAIHNFVAIKMFTEVDERQYFFMEGAQAFRISISLMAAVSRARGEDPPDWVLEYLHGEAES